MVVALASNVVIDVLRGRETVRLHLASARSLDEPMQMSCLAFEEVMIGVHRQSDPRRAQEALQTVLRGVDIVPFDQGDAELAARVRAEMEASGVKAPRIDFLIGAHALARGHTLVTANTRDFQNIPGLRLLDWTQPPAHQDIPHA